MSETLYKPISVEVQKPISVTRGKTKRTVTPKPKDPRKRIWDNYQAVAEVPRSTRTKTVVGAGIRDGIKFIVIREYYYNKTLKEWLPGWSGTTIPLTIPVNMGTKILTPFEALMDCMRQVQEVLETMPLADPANALYYNKETKQYET